ncbi:hypothetical protein HID58_004960, partial [Brassica napus]
EDDENKRKVTSNGYMRDGRETTQGNNPREKVRERKADRVEGSDVRTVRERACRHRSPSIFRRVIFYGFSHLSSPYCIVGALVRALAVVVTSGGDPSPVEALCLE